MGSVRGRRLRIFKDDEVEGLSNHDHRKLEEHVLEELCKLLQEKPTGQIGEAGDMVKQRSKAFLDGLKSPRSG
jgi:hypothetical protein